jgi:4-hydroxy-tetrahydrodipicolinate synthase
VKAEYITPAVTAFGGRGGLDREAQMHIYDYLIRGGVDGIVILGSIGEFFAMDMEQKKELIRFAVSHIGGRTRVIAGTAGGNIDETVSLSLFALEQGCDAVIVISPYYFALTDQSVEAYYDELAQKCPGYIYLYNFPDRTGCDLSAEVTLNLLRRHKNIVGYKDTCAGMEHTRELIKAVKPEFPGFRIYSGFDDNFAHNVLAGGNGCIAGLSNLVPEICADWVRAFEDLDLRKVSLIQRTIDRLMSVYSVGKPFIPYIKKAMMLRGIPMSEYCTFPLPKVTQQDEQTLRRILERDNLL